MSVQVDTILCPIDFSAHGRAALAHAAELGQVLGAEVVVCHVVTPPTYPGVYGMGPTVASSVEQEAREAASTALDREVQALTDRGLQARALLEVGFASRRLTEIAREQAVDLVVMGTHGLTGFGHLLLGSTAEHVVRTCPCPVLTVKADESVGEERS